MIAVGYDRHKDLKKLKYGDPQQTNQIIEGKNR